MEEETYTFETPTGPVDLSANHAIFQPGGAADPGFDIDLDFQPCEISPAHPTWTDEIPSNQPHFTDVKLGKRRGREQEKLVNCHYCLEKVKDRVYTCPGNPQEPKLQFKFDLEYEFCSPECILGWAMYEIGDDPPQKFYSGVERMIRERENRNVVPAPSWCELLSSNMGGLTVRNEFMKTCREDATGESAVSINLTEKSENRKGPKTEKEETTSISFISGVD